MSDIYCPKGPFPLQITDLERSTVGWTAEERYRYLRLLTVMWSNGGIIEDDTETIADAMALNRARNWREKAEKVKYKLVSHPTKTGFLTQTRLWTEIAKAAENSEKKRQAAEIRWAKEHSGATQVEMQVQCPPTPTPTSSSLHTKNHPKGAAAPPSKYAFEGKTIKVNKADYEGWRKQCPTLVELNQFDGILWSRDAWLQTESEVARRSWFNSTPNHLRNMDRKAAIELQTAGKSKAPSAEEHWSGCYVATDEEIDAMYGEGPAH